MIEGKITIQNGEGEKIYDYLLNYYNIISTNHGELCQKKLKYKSY